MACGGSDGFEVNFGECLGVKTLSAASLANASGYDCRALANASGYDCRALANASRLGLSIPRQRFAPTIVGPSLGVNSPTNPGPIANYFSYGIKISSGSNPAIEVNPPSAIVLPSLVTVRK